MAKGGILHEEHLYNWVVCWIRRNVDLKAQVAIGPIPVAHVSHQRPLASLYDLHGPSTI